jgi:hypothetical protein
MRLYIPLLVVTSLQASAAVAAEPASADALIEQGIALRQKHQFVEALELFRRAHAAAPSGKTLAQIGLTEGSLKQWVDAETHLAAALDAHDTPWIDNTRNRDAISQALALVRSHVGLVSVVGPAGADIAIAGASVGRLPLPGPIHVAEGRVRIEGSGDGRESASVLVLVPGGHELTVHLNLPLLPVSVAHRDTAPEASAVVAPPLGQPSLLGTAPEATSWKTWTGGGLLAVSAGLIATGIVWVAMDGHDTCNLPSPVDRCMRVYDTKTQGLITGAAGIVAGAVGGILVWQGHHSDTRLGLGYGALTASGTF